MKRSKITFKCPYSEISCLYIDTCGMSVEKSCKEYEKQIGFQDIPECEFLEFTDPPTPLMR